MLELAYFSQITESKQASPIEEIVLFVSPIMRDGVEHIFIVAEVLDAGDRLPPDDDVIENQIVDEAVLHAPEDLLLLQDVVGGHGDVLEHHPMQVPRPALVLVLRGARRPGRCSLHGKMMMVSIIPYLPCKS